LDRAVEAILFQSHSVNGSADRSSFVWNRL
jgi:hypothetical protein